MPLRGIPSSISPDLVFTAIITSLLRSDGLPLTLRSFLRWRGWATETTCTHIYEGNASKCLILTA